MKKIATLIIALLLLGASVFAQTTSAVAEPSAELAPSYSVFAGVDPLILADNMLKVANAITKLSHKMSCGRMYWDVPRDDYYVYSSYLLMNGYQGVAGDIVRFLGSSWVISIMEKENISFSVWYSRDTNCLLEFYPEDVKCKDLETIIFGFYEQDNNTSNGKEPIEWLVLAKENNRMLVISRYILECRAYNIGGNDTTWETCTLRAWLNNDFFNAAFSRDEQAMIPVVNVPDEENPIYHHAGKATQDKVFLLSIAEVKKYFSKSIAQQCRTTAYADGLGVYTDDRGLGKWWLRTVGINRSHVAYVYPYGDVRKSGGYSFINDIGIRPAMWIDLELYTNSLEEQGSGTSAGSTGTSDNVTADVQKEP